MATVTASALTPWTLSTLFVTSPLSAPPQSASLASRTVLWVLIATMTVYQPVQLRPILVTTTA